MLLALGIQDLIQKGYNIFSNDAEIQNLVTCQELFKTFCVMKAEGLSPFILGFFIVTI